jgi:hypothetical protein
MPGRTCNNRLLCGHARLLRDHRQRVVLGKNANDGLARSVAGDKTRRHVRQSPFHPEAFGFQRLG